MEWFTVGLSVVSDAPCCMEWFTVGLSVVSDAPCCMEWFTVELSVSVVSIHTVVWSGLLLDYQ